MLTGVGSPVDWDYDSEQDVLYLDVGEPAASFVEEVPGVEGLHIRRALSDRRITGAVVLWYSVQNRSQLVQHLPFRFDFSVVR